MTNFERMADDGRRLFLTYDRDGIAGKYGTEYDDEYLYIRFVGRKHRINRDDGFVEVSSGDGWESAGPGEALIFYDVFCYGKPYAVPSGEFVSHNSLVSQISATASPGEGLHVDHIRRFSGNAGKLKSAWIPLNGKPFEKGDAAFDLALFDFMDCRFQFWDADDEFPASIVLFFDKSILQYMHFETTWYAANSLLERIAGAAGL